MIKYEEQKEMVKFIRDQLSAGVELRDIADFYDVSCRTICRLIAEDPDGSSRPSDSSEPDNPEDDSIDLDLNIIKFEFD